MQTISSKYDDLKKEKSDLFFILSFPHANDYLIKVLLQQEEEVAGKTDQVIDRLNVAVLSNPFLGFTPDGESLRSSFIGDRFYHVRNYDGIPYVINYKLDFFKFMLVSFELKYGLR